MSSSSHQHQETYVGCSDKLGTFQISGAVDSTSKQFFPAGRWIPSIGVDSMDFGLIPEVITGDVGLLPGYQYAKVRPRAPDAPLEVSGTYVQSTANPDQFRKALGDEEFYWIRPGLFAKVVTSTPGYFQATLCVSKRQCGAIVGKGEFDMNPPANNSLRETVVLSPWVPTIGIDKFRGIAVATGCVDIEARFYCRTAIDDEAPNDWEAMGSWASLADGNNDINTGSGGTDISIPAGANITTNSLIQFGFATRMKSAGSDPQGFFRVMAGLTYT